MKDFFWDSKDEATGLPYAYDTDPNVTWDGILEPGDPGYTPPSTPEVQPKSKPKKMKHNTFYPTSLPLQTRRLL